MIGVGNIGGALAIALSRAGHSISQLVTNKRNVDTRVRTRLPANSNVCMIGRLNAIEAEFVFITTQDPVIKIVANDISRLVRSGQTVFHTSGSLSSDVLKVLAQRGCEIASVHPLASISDPVRGSKQFAGTYFCVEGSKKGAKVGRKLVRDVGGRPFTIETSMKPLYHAAAVMTAGHVTALFDSAVEILMKCGVRRDEAAKIFFPLIDSTVQNLAHQAPEEALTGSFARLDLDAFERHVKLLRRHLPHNFVELYLLLGTRSLDLVERRSGRNTMTREFRKRISMAKEKSR